MPKSYPRPKFVREETWRLKRVKESWRSPKGKSSRVRRSKKGWPAVVKIGYARPNDRKGLHPSGLKDIVVWRTQDLQKLDPKTQAARIAHTVGENKRILIIEEARRKDIRILNPGPKKQEENVVPAGAPEDVQEAEKTKSTEKRDEEKTA